MGATLVKFDPFCNLCREIKTNIPTLECLIKGHARLFISKKMSSVSTDFYVVKYFFHPARLFGLLHKRAGGVATLPVY